MPLTGCETFGFTEPQRSIGPETLDRIDKGSTRDDWVLAVMGQPSATARIGGGDTEIWKYPYKTEGKSGGRMILLGSRDKTAGERVIYVQLSNGIVTDWWKD